MSTHDNPRVVVLAAVDASEAAAAIVVHQAARQAHTDGGELHIVHCLPLPLDVSQSTTMALEQGRALLERAAGNVAGTKVVLHLAAGAPWMEIIQLAGRIQADLIVVGTHDYSPLKRLVLGSVADQVVKKASCPVLVVRPRDYEGKAPPGIERPCTDCLATQRRTRGGQLWCDRHASHHVHGRLHYQFPEGFGEGSMLLKPEQGM